MSQKTVQKYIEEKARFTSSDKAIDKIAYLLRGVSVDLISYRDNFMFSNSSVGLPAEVTFNASHKNANARDWPTPDQINQALGEWHAASSSVNGAWHALSEDERSALKPPLKAATR